MISTALNQPQSVWNSLIRFWQTISIFFLLQSVWKVVYAAQIQRRESRKLLMNGQRPLYFLSEAIPRFDYIKFHHRATNRSKYADGFYNSMINDKDGHIPSPLIMFTCTALGSVSNRSKLPGRFRDQFHPNPDHGNGSYHTKNPDCRKWGGFTTKNPAFDIDYFGSN